MIIKRPTSPDVLRALLVGVISELSLLVLYSAPRGFSPGTPLSPLLKNQDLI